MIELVDDSPQVNVSDAEYARLLGYPRGHELEGRPRELADWARAWYAAHGRPWLYARRAQHAAASDGAVVIDGATFDSPPLAYALREANAESVVVAAVSAGSEIEAAAARAWRDEKPDEYFFLEAYGSAVVEHLTMLAGARLCAWADGAGLAVLPHYSPGYPQWDVGQQPRLAELLVDASGHELPARLEALSSGMLRPKKSLLAVFGLTAEVDRVRRLAELTPCTTCALAPCQFRRAAYEGPSLLRPVEAPASMARARFADRLARAPLNLAAPYSINVKALTRWARERLVVEEQPDGAIEARFRYDGTTCTNMGRPLAFEYTVRLSPPEKGYAIEFSHCGPAPGDDGHRSMCRYLDDGPRLLAAIADERPLAGAPLDEVLAWRRPSCAAGCYCDAVSRQHKWGLVLETIHFALAERMRRRAASCATEGQP
jgi:hypothetical protein